MRRRRYRIPPSCRPTRTRSLSEHIAVGPTSPDFHGNRARHHGHTRYKSSWIILFKFTATKADSRRLMFFKPGLSAPEKEFRIPTPTWQQPDTPPPSPLTRHLAYHFQLHLLPLVHIQYTATYKRSTVLVCQPPTQSPPHPSARYLARVRALGSDWRVGQGLARECRTER